MDLVDALLLCGVACTIAALALCARPSVAAQTPAGATQAVQQQEARLGFVPMEVVSAQGFNGQRGEEVMRIVVVKVRGRIYVANSAGGILDAGPAD